MIQTAPHQSGPNATPLHGCPNRNGRKSQRALGRLQARQRYIPADISVLLGDERDDEITVRAQVLHEPRFVLPAKSVDNHARTPSRCCKVSSTTLMR